MCQWTNERWMELPETSCVAEQYRLDFFSHLFTNECDESRPHTHANVLSSLWRARCSRSTIFPPLFWCLCSSDKPYEKCTSNQRTDPKGKWTAGCSAHVDHMISIRCGENWKTIFGIFDFATSRLFPEHYFHDIRLWCRAVNAACQWWWKNKSACRDVSVQRFIY